METPIMQLDTNYVDDEVLFDKTLSFPLLPSGYLFPLGEIKFSQLPSFDFNNALFGKWEQDYSYYLNPDFSNSMNLHYAGVSPLLYSGAIFNQAAYKISDKFTFGGNSFGGKSIFSAPLSNAGKNGYDFKGASMFMQYKVSKNFKIETRVSVTNR